MESATAQPVFCYKENSRKGSFALTAHQLPGYQKTKAMYIKSFRAYQRVICGYHHSNSLQMEGTTIFPHT
jgi:hypothetical protein